MTWVLLVLTYGFTGGIDQTEIGHYETKALCDEARNRALQDVPTRQWICAQEKKRSGG